jgi:hypothetical protein
MPNAAETFSRRKTSAWHAASPPTVDEKESAHKGTNPGISKIRKSLSLLRTAKAPM